MSDPTAGQDNQHHPAAAANDRADLTEDGRTDATVYADSIDRLRILANGVRLSILLALAESPESRLSYDSLRCRTARETDEFEHHLDRLAGQFVHREGDTYALTDAGRQVGAAMKLGLFGDGPMGDFTGTADGPVSLSFTFENATIRATLNEHFEIDGVTVDDTA